jgi:hypothetical protein
MVLGLQVGGVHDAILAAEVAPASKPGIRHGVVGLHVTCPTMRYHPAVVAEKGGDHPAELRKLA